MSSLARLAGTNTQLSPRIQGNTLSISVNDDTTCANAGVELVTQSYPVSGEFTEAVSVKAVNDDTTCVNAGAVTQSHPVSGEFTEAVSVNAAPLDETFVQFLKLLTLTPGSYSQVTIRDRLSILKEYRKSLLELEAKSPSSAQHVSSSRSSGTGVPVPEAEPAQVVLAVSLPGPYELYGILSRHEDFIALKNQLHFKPFKRRRFRFPRRVIGSDFAAELSSKQILWLERIFAHCVIELPKQVGVYDMAASSSASDSDEAVKPEQEANPSDYSDTESDEEKQAFGVAASNFSVLFLFQHILARQCLSAFLHFVHNQPNDVTLAPVTLRAGLYQLSSVVYTLGNGKKLSAFAAGSDELRAARESIRQIEDACATFNRMCIQHLNSNEATKILFNQKAISSNQFIKQLYFFCTCTLSLSPSLCLCLCLCLYSCPSTAR